MPLPVRKSAHPVPGRRREPKNLRTMGNAVYFHGAKILPLFFTGIRMTQNQTIIPERTLPNYESNLPNRGGDPCYR